jgi:hypothetical protein
MSGESPSFYVMLYGPKFLREAIKCHLRKSVKECNHCSRTSQQSDPGLFTSVGIDYYRLHTKYCPFLLSEWIGATLSLKKSAEEAWRQKR